MESNPAQLPNDDYRLLVSRRCSIGWGTNTAQSLNTERFNRFGQDFDAPLKLCNWNKLAGLMGNTNIARTQHHGLGAQLRHL